MEFERELRTPHSEAYTILEDGSIVGRIDLHYQGEIVYGTLCTTLDAKDDRVRMLIEAVDERLVMTSDPYREDFVVTVWRGSPAGEYRDADVNGDSEGDVFTIGDVRG